MRPFISLITPVYNIERLISKTIESALEQSFKDWEMILIDDGSPDNAGKICDAYKEKDSRIKVIHKANAGLAAARNSGIKACSGKYFLIFEGSDLLVSEKTLQEIHDDIEDKDIDIYFALLQDMMEKDWQVTNVQKKYCVDGLYLDGGKNLFNKLYDNEDTLALSSPVNKVFRTDFIKDNNLWFYEGIYHDDDEWLPRTISLSNKSYFTDRIIYNALTWDGCFGQMASDKSLTRKACDKMLIADHCLLDIDERFKDDTIFKHKYYEYYVRMYIDGIVALNVVKDEECLTKINNSIKEHKNVFEYMRNVESRNLKILAYIYKIVGLELTKKMILRRYSK